MKNQYPMSLFLCIASILILIISLISCNTNGPEASWTNDDDNGEEGTQDHDDAGGMAPLDDDDDAPEDDDNPWEIGSPYLIDAYWEPGEIDMTETCTENPCTTLCWEVCDPNGNLSGGGIWIYTGSLPPDMPIDWDDFLTGDENLTDCINPPVFGLPVTFDGALDDWCPESGQSYFISVDIEVFDADENFGNMILDVELIWNCA